ncbi:UNVERIFIED_CONTAM: hypothetical protein RMT77_006679 [Armadillidium vulgare]|nr:N-alpha-acetyltransferase 38, NatC auxiliary subunit [Armadillidium vulgare]
MRNSDFKDNLVNISEEADKNEKPPEPTTKPPLSPTKDSEGRRKLRNWLHGYMKVEMTDGRILVGTFVCTDRDNNIILASCTEHLQPDDDGREEEPRVLGLAMVPGRHVVSISIDESYQSMKHLCS